MAQFGDLIRDLVNDHLTADLIGRVVDMIHDAHKPEPFAVPIPEPCHDPEPWRPPELAGHAAFMEGYGAAPIAEDGVGTLPPELDRAVSRAAR